MYSVTVGPLESAAWITQIGPSVNPVPSDSFTATQLQAGDLLVTNVGSKAYAGALVANKISFPNVGVPLPWVGLDLQVLVPSETAYNLGRLENDVKIVLNGAPAGGTAANVFNFSSQVNMSEGGMLQVADINGNWVDTGNKIGTIAPDVWHRFSYRYFMDIPGNKFSVKTISYDTTSYTVPGALQGVPLQTSNWAAVVATQLQTEMFNPGVVLTRYKGVLTFSDQAF